MCRKPLPKNAFRTCRIPVLLVLAAFQFSPADAEESFTIAMNDGLITGMLPESNTAFSIPVADAEVATLNTGNRRIWVYGKQRLQAFQPDGSQLIDQYLPELSAGDSATDLAIGFDSVWLAVGRNLYRFDEQGTLIKHSVFHNTIDSINFDSMKSQVLINTPRYVFVLDRNGHILKRIRTHLPNVA